MKRVLTTIILVVFILAKADGDVKSNKQGLSEISQPKNVVIICDVSRSVDVSSTIKTSFKNRFQEMISQCENILTAYPPNTTFSFFFVSRNGNAAPFARLKSEEVTKMNGRTVMDKFKRCKIWLAKCINTQSANPESQSCIMTSIESAYITLKGLASTNNINASDLIIISDMVEVCWASPVDTLIMNVKNGKNVVSSKSIEKIEKYTPDINFDSIGLNIKILFNAGYIDIKKEKQLEDIWRTILSKYGYKAASNKSRPIFLTNFIFQKDPYYTENHLNF